ncbi:MAG TPA: hypothetical protein DEQ61_00340 [Streptomyces sp.]|nr:hypothetical protein [Streptomyces sp.]
MVRMPRWMCSRVLARRSAWSVGPAPLYHSFSLASRVSVMSSAIASARGSSDAQARRMSRCSASSSGGTDVGEVTPMPVRIARSAQPHHP